MTGPRRRARLFYGAAPVHGPASWSAFSRKPVSIMLSTSTVFGTTPALCKIVCIASMRFTGMGRMGRNDRLRPHDVIVDIGWTRVVGRLTGCLAREFDFFVLVGERITQAVDFRRQKMRGSVGALLDVVVAHDIAEPHEIRQHVARRDDDLDLLVRRQSVHIPPIRRRHRRHQRPARGNGRHRCRYWRIARARPECQNDQASHAR